MILNSPYISGSLTVTGNEVVTGSLTVLGGITGAITGSATSASFATNASLLNGTGSGGFTSVNSFNSYTSSNDATVTSVAMSTALALASIATLTSRTGSYTTTSSFNSYTASNDANVNCVSSTATAAIVGVGALASRTGSYATTGSNTFDGGQYLSSSFNPTGFSTTASLYTDGGLRVTKDAYISGTLYLNNVTVYGTQSVAYISSSQLNIGTNLITVNTDTPSIRFGGLAVYDSGSTGLTGSLLWDSQNNHWIYSNPSGSSYSGGMFISGPRTSTLGSETGTTSCMLLAGQGGDHLTSSMIYHSSTATCIPNTLIGSTICTTMTNASCIGIGTQAPAAPLTIKSTGATGILMACDGVNQTVSSRLFFESCFNQFSVLNSGGKLQFNYGASLPSTSGTLGMVMDSCGNLLVGTGTASGTEKLSVTKDDGAGDGLHPIADFNRSLGSSAELILGYMANGTDAIGPVIYSSNGFPLLFSAGSATRMCILSSGNIVTTCGITIGSTATITAPSNATTLKLNGRSSDGIGQILMYANDGTTLYNYIGSSASSLAISTETNTPIYFQTNMGVNGGTKMTITGGGFVGIRTTTPCSLLNVNCVSNGGDSLYTNMFTITTDVNSVYNHLALSPTSLEYRRDASTGVDLCIMTKVCNGSSGGNIVFAPNLENTTACSYPRMKIQQNGFIGIGAFCAQTYLHICDNLSAGRDDLIRLQTNISTNHVWLKSISCAGVTSIFGSNRANTDGNLIANHAVAGTTSGHNFDLISNSTVRVRLSSSGAVCLLGNSNDYPSLFLAGPTYTMIAMGDRSSSAATDVGYLSVYNQGAVKIDLPGNADPVVFNNGGPMIAGRAYASGDPRFGYQFLEFCNGETYHGPLSLGNSGGGLALTPLYCGGGQRWNFGWDSGALNAIISYNNCTPILIAWGVNGDSVSSTRKFCFNYDGNAYNTGGTWGTMSSNCIIKEGITGASSQWNDVKSICIVNYKMKEEIEEYGTAARIHLGVIAEQVAEVSPGLLEDGGYNCRWCACLKGVKTSILHMKAVKALQEAMCRIEILETCLGIV